MGPALLCPLPGRRSLYKAPFPLDQHIQGICPQFASDPFMEEGFALCGWWRPCVASVTLVSGLCQSCRDPATFNKASVRGFRRLRRLGPLVVKMSAGRWHSRPLAQPAPQSKPASLAGCHSDPWDVSRQMALPLAYPDNHPHDIQTFFLVC
jgi:hypothetical protein